MHKKEYSVLAIGVIVALAVVSYAQLARQSSQPPNNCGLKEEGTVILPKTVGRIDHLAISDRLGILAVAARDNNSVVIMNLTSLKIIGATGGFNLPQGVAFVEKDNALVVTNGGNGTVSILGSLHLGKIDSFQLPPGADNVELDKSTGLLYVGYGVGGIAIINTSNRKIAGIVPLIGHPESFKVEGNGSLLFVNVPQGNYIAVANKTGGKVLGVWPIRNATGVYPMALDAEHHLLYVASRSPSEFLVISTDTGTEIKRLSIPADADDVFYDSLNGCIYISSGEGYVTVIKEVARSYQVVQNIPTSPGARTSLLDPSSRIYFVAAPRYQNQSARIIEYRIEG